MPLSSRACRGGGLSRSRTVSPSRTFFFSSSSCVGCQPRRRARSLRPYFSSGYASLIFSPVGEADSFPGTTTSSATVQPGAEQPIGGKFWEGATHIARSPYLLGLAGFLMIYTLTNTWAYFQQSDLTGHQLQDRAARTSF